VDHRVERSHSTKEEDRNEKDRGEEAKKRGWEGSRGKLGKIIEKRIYIKRAPRPKEAGKRKRQLKKEEAKKNPS